VTYIVMEYVLNPDGLRLGPVQRGHINHTLFTEDGACAEYESVDHLQRHFNKVYAVPLNIPSVNTRLRYCTYTSHTVLGAQGGNTCVERPDPCNTRPTLTEAPLPPRHSFSTSTAPLARQRPFLPALDALCGHTQPTLPVFSPYCLHSLFGPLFGCQCPGVCQCPVVCLCLRRLLVACVACVCVRIN
jgi:hypothetical protein